MPPVVELRDDHVLIRLEGGDALAALRRQIVVPYSTIMSVEAARPEWPALWTTVGLGLRAPPLVLKGTTRPWSKRQAFWFQDKGTKRVGRFHLDGHAFATIHLDVGGRDAADELAEAIAARLVGPDDAA